MKKNIVLSLMKSSYDYPTREFKPFVESLKKTGFDGDIVMFTNSLDKKTKNYFKKNGITIVPFEFEYPYIKNNKAIIQDFSEFKNIKLNIFHHREFLPMLYLLDNKEIYDSVVIADSADVIFQKNPFDEDYDKRNVYFSLQDNKIKDSKRDAEWIEKVYGKAGLNKIKENQVCCTGLILGGFKPVINYLQVLAREFKKGFTIDQGNHNYLLHTGKIKNSVMLDNQEGIMLTCSGSKRPSFIRGRDNKIRALSGRVYSMIHQYDTYPEWSFMIRGICRRSLREYIKRLPLLGKFLVDTKALFVKNYVHMEE